MSRIQKVAAAAMLLAALVIAPSTASARPLRFAARAAARTAVVATPPYGRVYYATPVYMAPRVYVAPAYGPAVIYFP